MVNLLKLSWLNKFSRHKLKSYPLFVNHNAKFENMFLMNYFSTRQVMPYIEYQSIKDIDSLFQTYKQKCMEEHNC